MSLDVHNSVDWSENGVPQNAIPIGNMIVVAYPCPYQVGFSPPTNPWFTKDLRKPSATTRKLMLQFVVHADFG